MYAINLFKTLFFVIQFNHCEIIITLSVISVFEFPSLILSYY